MSLFNYSFWLKKQIDTVIRVTPAINNAIPSGVFSWLANFPIKKPPRPQLTILIILFILSPPCILSYNIIFIYSNITFKNIFLPF